MDIVSLLGLHLLLNHIFFCDFIDKTLGDTYQNHEYVCVYVSLCVSVCMHTHSYTLKRWICRVICSDSCVVELLKICQREM